MKKPIMILVAIILGIVATNALVASKNKLSGHLIEDAIKTKQAAPQTTGDIPL